jgi:drug/metabolite transporter (DMT)-like permease
LTPTTTESACDNARSPSKTRVYATLGLGVLAVSSAAILIRFAQDANAPSLSIAAGRLALASLIIVPIALATCGADLRKVSRTTMARASLIGALLAAHFWFWIASLGQVSVALSTALVSTTPVWVALGAWCIRGERLTAPQVLGLLFAVAGGAGLALVSGDVVAGKSIALGCLLALAGSWAIAANMLLGQSMRAQLPVRAYAALAYGWAAVWLIVAALITQTPLLGLHPNAYWAMFALALVPQLIGHTSLNWALPFVGATTVAVSVLAEPLGAALIATVALKEPISLAMGLCFGLTLVGIGLVAMGGRKTS